MTVELIVIGKTDSKEVAALVEMYARRVKFYCKFAVTALPDVRNTRNLTVKQQRTAEGEAILRQTTDGDYVVLLDERGEEMRSVEFAYWLQKRMNSGVKRLVLVIGGPYGFSDEVYRRADAKLSLSRMTFSHQIVRAIFAEQIYRAFTILNNEPYHHDHRVDARGVGLARVRKLPGCRAPFRFRLSAVPVQPCGRSDFSGLRPFSGGRMSRRGSRCREWRRRMPSRGGRKERQQQECYEQLFEVHDKTFNSAAK